MASSFFSFLPFRQKPATTKTNATLPPTPPFSRIMASGRCTAFLTAGTYKVPCPCLRGKFEAPLTTLDVECKGCAHPLSQHNDASSTPAPGSFLLPQGMASSGHVISAISSGVAYGHVLNSGNDALTCPREATVAALWNQLKKCQVVHVRGTPTSGKSTL